MPNENEFYKQMHNYFLYFNLFGMWSVWKNSKHKLFFQVHLILSSIVVLLKYIYVVFFNRFFIQNSFLGNLNNFLFIFIFASHLTIKCETHFSTNIQLQIIENLSFFDRYVGIKFGIRIQYQRQKRKLIVLSIMLMLPIILTNIMAISYINIWKVVYLNVLLSMYSTWITRSRFLQIIFFVYLLRERLKIINFELNRLRNSILGQSKQYTFQRLLQLKKAYEQLYDTCELINNTFGWSLLAIVVQCFVDITINCYATFLYVERASYEDLIGLIILCGMAGLHLNLLATLAFFSSSCSEYVRTIFSLFHPLQVAIAVYVCYNFPQVNFIEANVRRISSGNDDGPLNDLVHEFNMQIFHEPCHISANQFFPINLNLLGSVSRICNYLEWYHYVCCA